ncbi:hypothetical protein GWK47_029509 [Chionoecetes opilio]|uniref:Uncharacterized protein n=1 Tax=Chionoecetes opilio TaxID=41210 RepID=A0A8J4YSF1_CHIOP|nr:hypothetical protein GWK47_029509 [Chionoecetes opilio]
MSEKEPRISDALKDNITRHEARLQGISQSLVHAHTHLQALANLADKLKLHLHAKKTQPDKHKLLPISECTKQDKETSKAAEDEDARYFKFPTVGANLDWEFLGMVECLVEGVMLVSDEINIGRLARDLRGAPMQEDLMQWRKTVTVLQKYDDQVRRAIDYFQRQQDD